MDSKKLALLCRELAENKKAENIVILDVRKLSSITDYFVLASGTSEPHLRAIISEITDRLRDEHQVRPRAVEGNVHTSWQVVDYFDVIVHLMRGDVREKYDLETLWGDAPRIGSGAEAEEVAEKPKKAKPLKPAKKTRAPKAAKTAKAAKAAKPAKTSKPRKRASS